MLSAGKINTITPIKESGGGGTDNYNDLTNKPKINNVTLQGNKTSSELSLAGTADDNTFTGMNTFDDSIMADSLTDSTGIATLTVADDGTRKVGSVLKGLKLASDTDIEVRKGSETNIGTVIDTLNKSTLLLEQSTDTWTFTLESGETKQYKVVLGE